MQRTDWRSGKARRETESHQGQRPDTRTTISLSPSARAQRRASRRASSRTCTASTGSVAISSSRAPIRRNRSGTGARSGRGSPSRSCTASSSSTTPSAMSRMVSEMCSRNGAVLCPGTASPWCCWSSSASSRSWRRRAPSSAVGAGAVRLRRPGVRPRPGANLVEFRELLRQNADPQCGVRGRPLSQRNLPHTSTDCERARNDLLVRAIRQTNLACPRPLPRTLLSLCCELVIPRAQAAKLAPPPKESE